MDFDQLHTQPPAVAEKVQYDYFACCAIMGLMFIPLSNTGNLIRILVVLFVLVLKIVKNRFSFTFPRGIGAILGLMVAGSLISVVFVVLTEGKVNSSLLQHELIRLGFNMVLISLVPTLKIPFNFIYKSSLAVLVFHVVIQIIQKTGLGGINAWIRQTYVDPNATRTHLILAEDLGSNFRSGSIFLNPNVYMVIPCIVLCMILQKNLMKREGKNYFFVLIVLVSLFLTGSRTALFVFAAIAIYLFSTKSVGVQQKLLTLIFGAVLLVCMFVFAYDSLESARIFQVTTAVDGSLGAKVLNTLEYLSSANIVYYLFGGMASTSVSDVMLDSEWGYIIKFYGLIGLIWYYKLIVRNPDRHSPQLALFYKTARISIILIAVSATVFFCMPIFPYVCLVTMSDVDIGPVEDNEATDRDIRQDVRI